MNKARITQEYFGRNLDLEFSYHEEIVVAPRNFSFNFRKCASIDEHYAIIGTALDDCR
ncbi:MAG: linear amide C-N hydrolase [Lachnospiraceae bacterium]|nr:linear amide C-N hydrolase [Lachnospiraceae bacterium]MBQ9392311.1 linear amide C-N hydrolase [Lachnospiraceae bacterium]